MRSFAAYEDLGVNVEAALVQAAAVPISIHCWQADDVVGLESAFGGGSGGILATGNYPGRARDGNEIRSDLEWVLARVPGQHRLNLHAMYAESEPAAARDEVAMDGFRRWQEWAQINGLSIDFNPTFFAHPLAADGSTLSHPDEETRQYWIRHGQACRRIAGEFAREQGAQSVVNHWIPDGAKDSPIDRWSPRARLRDSLDEILAEPIEGLVDCVESKLFGLGSEDYVVGSFEFYSQYVAANPATVLCLDMGHFHPTETIHDKISALLTFQDRLLLHVSRPIRWDSDHVVVFNDDSRALFSEVVRGGALDRTLVALDFFDASICRVAAYVIGIRATRKAILAALLEPTAKLRELEREGRSAEKLALLEEVKTLPFGEAWNEFCERSGVAGAGWIEDILEYEAKVTASRN